MCDCEYNGMSKEIEQKILLKSKKRHSELTDEKSTINSSCKHLNSMKENSI